MVSDCLRPHGLQYTRLPCPSPTPRAYPDSCPLNQWCHPTISSSVIPFSCLQSFPASGSFSISQFFASGGQKYWSFSFNIGSSSGYSGLISFSIFHVSLIFHYQKNCLVNILVLYFCRHVSKRTNTVSTRIHFQFDMLSKSWTRLSDFTFTFHLQYQSFQWIFRTDFL